MRSNLDKNYNRISKLDKSKWTSLKKLNGWRHYEVVNIDKKNNKIELFAVCEKSKRIIVKKEDLKDKRFWLRGWKNDLGIGIGIDICKDCGLPEWITVES